MEQSYQHTDNVPAPRPVSIPSTLPSSAPPRRKNGSNAQNFGGIHLRRDKRFPFAQHVVPDVLPPLPAAFSPSVAAEPDPLKSWKEAVMLWLSWNSTYEKVTAKMCKPGYDQKKIEALMDEMDKLRKRAIDSSEKLMG